MLFQSRRALDLLSPDNLPTRATTTWTLGYAYQLQGDRAAAERAYNDAISISQASGNIMVTIAATTCLGQVQESENQLYLAAESYRLVFQLAGDPPQPGACEAYLGLARVFYQWNDLDNAQRYGQQSLQLAQQMENVSTPAACEVLLARLKLAQGEVDSSAIHLAQAEQFVRQNNFMHLMPDVAAAQVVTMLHQGNLVAAAQLTETHKLPISQARVYLAQGDPSAALAVLEPIRHQVEANGFVDERFKIMVLQAVAFHTIGENEQAGQALGEVLALAEPEGFIRIFVDEGQPMALLLKEMLNRKILPNYVNRLLSAFPIDGTELPISSPIQAPKSELDELLSKRELEILQLLAQGFSNREISKRLFLALNTVKGHNQRIYSKLQVQSRTEAIARAREMDLL